MAVTLAIPDLHAPFHHKDALAFVKEVRERFKPGRIVLLGDEIDSHALSRFPRDPDGKSGGLEVHDARAELESWYEAFPVASVCTSNHTMRASRRAFEAGISKEWIKSAKEVLQAPEKWNWADFWTIDGARFEHGDALSGASYTAAHRMALYNRQTTVFGHFHTGGGVVHVNFNDLDLYGANSGCLIDADAYAFNYAKNFKQRPSLGCTVVVDGVPYWTPMRLDRHRRWTGKM